MFISLHNRSSYSFGSSLTRPEQLATFAAEHGIPAIALTDLNGLYAAVEFQKACKRVGVKPIFGAELVLTSHGVYPRGLPFLPTMCGLENRQDKPAGSSSHVGSALADQLVEDVTITLLVESLTGYGNLCRLISLYHLRETPLGCEDLCEHAEGLICLLGKCRSGLQPRQKSEPRGLSGEPRGLSPWYTRRINRRARQATSDQTLRDAFDTRLYIELAIHRSEDLPEARRRARIADEWGLPVVATCESRCLKREEMPALRALASIGTLTLLDEPHRDKPEGTWHLRTPSEMEYLFHRRPDALANTLAIAERCNVTIDLSANRFPPFESSDGRSAAQHVRDLCIAGCRRRYVEQPQQKGIGGKRPTLAEAVERLDRELAIIEQVHYAEYFLVFHEIVEYCRSRGIAVLARGSAADSLVCYALGVSHACPFRFDLPFDRFLNPERAKFSKMADIDLDLPWDRRDEVVQWVYDRWGHDRVAMIGSPNTFHGRAVVAELGKVFGLPPHEVYQITKHLPHTSADDLSVSVTASPEARGLQVEEEPLRTIFRMAGLFEGLPRHWSMHPCGLVVSPEPLTDLVPVQRSPKGPLVAQYDMDAIEELGFIKIDLLGQAGLSVLRDAVDEVRRTEGTAVDLERDVDYSEGETWDMIARGDARGVHHIESPAMTSLLVQSNCRDIDCLTAIVAIIRPGAANQGKKEAFCRRHQGFEPPGRVHPALTSVLAGTYGLMVFEEHILQAAVEFAGMNLGRADVLRRALNKENLAMIRRMEGEFREAARQRGRTESEINEVWAMMEGFRGFMFNKAHSAEYAVEAFQGAWLKRRWPAHYLAAVLSNYRGFYAHSPTLPQILYVMEALRLGIGFLPACVNRSRKRFSVEKKAVSDQHSAVSHVGSAPADREFLTSHGVSCPEPGRGDPRGLPSLPITYAVEDRQDKPAGSSSKVKVPHPLRSKGWGITTIRPMIRVPLTHIQELSQAFLERYLNEREKGAFESLPDFMHRCHPTETEWRLLLDSGALDIFGLSRPMLFWELRRLQRAGRAASGMLWDNQATDAIETPPVDLDCPDKWRIARREMDLLGFPITVDPITYLSRDDKGRTINWSRYLPVSQLHEHAGRRVSVCGLMVADRINRTTTGELMKFVTLADRTGFVETCLFPDAYRRFGHLTAANPILAVNGIVDLFENRQGFTLRAERVEVPRRVDDRDGPTPGVPVSALGSMAKS